jgi:hypothetical protein
MTRTCEYHRADRTYNYVTLYCCTILPFSICSGYHSSIASQPGSGTCRRHIYKRAKYKTRAIIRTMRWYVKGYEITSHQHNALTILADMGKHVLPSHQPSRNVHVWFTHNGTEPACRILVYRITDISVYLYVLVFGSYYTYVFRLEFIYVSSCTYGFVHLTCTMFMSHCCTYSNWLSCWDELLE